MLLSDEDSIEEQLRDSNNDDIFIDNNQNQRKDAMFQKMMFLTKLAFLSEKMKQQSDKNNTFKCVKCGKIYDESTQKLKLQNI